MNRDAVNALADYLTDAPTVVHFSVCLEMPQAASLYRAATRFYALRHLLGIRGYMDQEEAVKAIGTTLYEAVRSTPPHLDSRA